MTILRRRVLFGLLMWLIPFVVAFLIFGLHETQRPLFESIMAVKDIGLTYLIIPVVTVGLGYSLGWVLSPSVPPASDA